MNKRIAALLTILFLTFSLLCYRIYLLSVQNIYSVNTENTLKSDTVSTTRGNVYDTNLRPLTNATENYVAFIKPTAKGILAAQALEKNELLYELEKGKLVATPVPFSDFFENSNDVLTIATYERYSDNTLSHILGYCQNGKGMYGIEKHYDSLLNKTKGSITVKYHCDALGRALNGEPTEIHNDNYNNPAGLVLTIDKNIQRILEAALINNNTNVGCGIVLDVKTSEILACASVPVIDRKNLTQALTDENLPFINRAFSQYSVGSVFKVVTAAAALENGCEQLTYECNGSITKSNNTFNCNKHTGHGKMNLETALTFSCNPYFIELSCNVGAEKLLETSECLGLGKRCDLGNGYVTDPGNLPKKEELNSDAAIGNIGFGQGQLLATPLQMANCYAVIANNGIYNEPTLIKGYIDKNQKFSSGSKTPSKRVLKKETCETLKKYLLNVVTEGTGKPTFSSLFDSCGKTATAESGCFTKDGAEMKYSWYVGFFPYDEPEYVICIMKENGTSGGTDCAPTFKDVAENIYIHNKTQNVKNP